MAIKSVQKKITFSHTPLRTSGCIEVVGSVPDLQVFQADKNEYTPDYALTPLSLFPRCNATNPDSLTKSFPVNDKLTNMKWFEQIDGVKKQINSTNTSYVITLSGAEKGKIQMKKNVTPLKPVTLVFHAEYVDPKSGDKYEFNYSRLVRTIDGTEAVPVLAIDSPAGVEWNPCRDVAKQVIKASLMVADQDVAGTNKAKIFWYRVTETGALEAIVDGNGDNDFEVVSVANNVLTINRDMMGDGNTYVCKASYNVKGTPAATPDEGISPATTVIKRRIPSMEADWEGIPRDVPHGTTMVYPRPIIRDTKGVLTTAVAKEVFECFWYTKVGAEQFVEVASGFAPKIPFREGMDLQLKVEDKGPYVILTADTGEALTSDTGEIIVTKKY